VETIKYKKFISYKTLFVIFLILVLISWTAGYLLLQKSALLKKACEFSQGVYTKFSHAAFFEMLFLLWVFVSGPTIYAPASAITALTVYGVLSGARLMLCMGGGVYITVTESLFSLLSSYVLVIYSTFVTLTGLGIFTPKKTDKNERELFDGVMFRAKSFKGIFNMRFVGSYILFFLMFFALQTVLSAFKVFLLTL